MNYGTESPAALIGVKLAKRRRALCTDIPFMQSQEVRAQSAIKGSVRQLTVSGSTDGVITCSSRCGTRDIQNWQTSQLRTSSCARGLRRLHRQRCEHDSLDSLHDETQTFGFIIAEARSLWPLPMSEAIPCTCRVPRLGESGVFGVFRV